jgi:polycystin 1L2
LNGFIDDKSNRLLGWATMRQLRVTSELCPNQRIMSICEKEYSFFNEEKRSFEPGWNNNSLTVTYSSSILNAFQYSTSDELDTYIYVGDHATYSGNGYVYEFLGDISDLASNISKLEELGWIDNKTRAVFIEFTLYNPNVALFTSVTFLLEFVSSSGIFTSALFQPINFYSKSYNFLFNIFCSLI